MNREMRAWQWMGATVIAALSMSAGVFTFADSYMDKKIESRLVAPLSLVDIVSKRLDRIEEKLDELIQRRK